MSERFLPEGMKHASQAYELLADRLMGRLSGAEWKVCTYIARRTVGFGKMADRISLGQFQHGITTRGGQVLDGGTGLSRDAVQKAVSRLREHGLVIVRQGGRNQPNEFELNWQLIVSQKMTSQKIRLPGRTKNSPEVGRKSAPQLSGTLSVPPVSKKDLDCPATNRTNRDSQPDPSVITQYPRLKETLFQYFREDGYPDLIPSDRLVADVMRASGGASEQEVIAYLNYLYSTRGLQPGTRNGPKHWSWFPTVVQDYFDQKRRREEAANPIGHAAWADRNDVKLSREEFDAMTDAIEVPEEAVG